MTLESPGERLDRFHRVLVDEIRDRKPEYLSGPFTVAEIYQQLVPYASHRDRLGIEMNGDYEDALLRLLAGEGDYLHLQSDHARERLQGEAESANPDTSLYREFAALDVQLNPDRVPPPVEADEGSSDDEGRASDEEDGHGAASIAELAPAVGEEHGTEEHGTDEGDAGLADESEEPDAFDTDADPEMAAGPERVRDEGEAGGTCSWCRERLPDRENLNFCPFCGTDIGVVPCPSCGEALEPSWLFCIACGTAVADE